MTTTKWKRIAAGELTNGRLFIVRSYTAVTSSTWWSVGTVRGGGTLRSFMSLRAAKQWCDALAVAETKEHR